MFYQGHHGNRSVYRDNIILPGLMFWRRNEHIDNLEILDLKHHLQPTEIWSIKFSLGDQYISKKQMVIFKVVGPKITLCIKHTHFEEKDQLEVE